MRRVSPKINPANKLPSQSAAQEETLTFTPEIREKRHAVLGQRSLDRIGNTPLLRLDRLTRELPGVEILGKAEWMNPGGSVKDRAAANIVAEARRSAGFPSDAVHAGKRLRRAQAHPACVWREHYLHRPGRRIGWGDSQSARTCSGTSRKIFLCRSVFQRCQLARALSRHRQ